MSSPALDEIDAALPQTQCRQCGYAGCTAYAQAIVDGAPINRCAPGGADGIRELARLTGRTEIPLDPDYGTEAPFAVATIDADHCIGCRRCATVCPTDAVTGAPKHLFGVLSRYCTGCALCLAVCPTDCIAMKETGNDWTRENALEARSRHAAKTQRLKAKTEALAARTHTGATAKSAVMAGLTALMAARKRKSAP